MHEMLGNQYFMSRNYIRATEELELALAKIPRDKAIRKKLIICHTQIGNINRALDLFISLVKEDALFIIDTDPIDDDCPCADLVYEFEKKILNSSESTDYLVMLGILWLYCSVEKSKYYFEIARERQPANPKLNSVLALLNLQRTRKEI